MSLIDPSQFPVLQPEQAETAAGQLRSMGQAINTHTTNADTHWQGLSSCYQAPEAGVVVNLLKSAVKTGGDVAGTMAKAAAVLENYASALAGVKSRLYSLNIEAEVFRTEVFNTKCYRNYHTDRRWNDPIYFNLPTIVYHWDQWPPTVERNNELLADAAAIMADLSELESSYGQQILNLMTDQSQLPIVCSGDSAFPVYGADLFLASPVPWGQPQKRNYASWFDNLYSTTHDWIGGTASSIAGYVGVKWDWPPGFSPSLAGESWFGLGKLGLGAAIVLTNPLAIPLARHGDYPFSSSVNLYVSTTTGVFGYDYQAQLDGKDPWHQWRDDPQASATNAIYNVASLIVGAKTAKPNVVDVVTNAGPLIPGQPPGQVPNGGPPLKIGVDNEGSCPSAPITNTTTSTTIPPGADRRNEPPVTTPQPEGPPTVTTSTTPTTAPPRPYEPPASSPTTSTPTTSTTTPTTPTTVPQQGDPVGSGVGGGSSGSF